MVQEEILIILLSSINLTCMQISVAGKEQNIDANLDNRDLFQFWLLQSIKRTIQSKSTTTDLMETLCNTHGDSISSHKRDSSKSNR